MTVMLGVGGILAEAVADVAFRLVPIDRVDAEEMIDDLATRRCSGRSGASRPSTASAVVDVLVGLSAAAEARGRHRVGRPQPAARRRRRPGRRRRPRGGRTAA